MALTALSQRMDCSEQPMLATESSDGAGKCIPAVERLTNTDKSICGPYRKRPPDKVTSDTTVSLPPVDPNQLKARLYSTAPHQAPAGRNKLFFKRPTPLQQRKDAISTVPPLEPLVGITAVALHSSA
jgi:hypothetical protein